MEPNSGIHKRTRPDVGRGGSSGPSGRSGPGRNGHEPVVDAEDVPLLPAEPLGRLAGEMVEVPVEVRLPAGRRREKTARVDGPVHRRHLADDGDCGGDGPGAHPPTEPPLDDGIHASPQVIGGGILSHFAQVESCQGNDAFTPFVREHCPPPSRRGRAILKSFKDSSPTARTRE